MFSVKKIKKCPCGNKLPENPGTLVVDSADGEFELKICDECSEFWDKSSDIMRKRNHGQDGSI